MKTSSNSAELAILQELEDYEEWLEFFIEIGEISVNEESDSTL